MTRTNTNLPFASRFPGTWLLSACVFLVLGALTFLVWRQQVRHQRRLLNRHTRDVAFQASRRLQVFVESHLRVAAIFARRWSTHEKRDFSRKRFEEFASVLLQELPGYHTVSLIPPDGGPGWIVPAAHRTEERLKGAEERLGLKESFKAGSAVLSGPSKSASGESSFHAVLPLRRDKELLGFLAVRFRARTLINDCFHHRIRSEFYFMVRDGSRMLFRSSARIGPAHFASAPASARVEFRVRNRAWRLDMIPTRKTAAAIGWGANLSVPLLGFVLSVSLSLLVFLLFRRMEMFRAARDQHALLSRKVLMAHEEERARLARDLHDELGQLLTALRLETGWLKKKVGTGPSEERGLFHNTVELVEKSTDELRRICRGLRPPLLDDLGLGPAVRLLVVEFQDRTGISADLEIDSDGSAPAPPQDIALCLYRILQEALTNVSRHARASRVTVSVNHSPGMLELTVADDGEGFDATRMEGPTGWGIQGMQERAHLVGGHIMIRSFPQKGTRVVFWVELSARVEEGTQ